MNARVRTDGVLVAGRRHVGHGFDHVVTVQRAVTPCLEHNAKLQYVTSTISIEN